MNFNISEAKEIRRMDIVNWYLKEIESEIATRSELEEKTFLVNKILDRLINNVSRILF